MPFRTNLNCEYCKSLFSADLNSAFFSKFLLTLYSRVMKVLKNLEYHHWHSLKSKLDYQWPTCPKRTGKEFEKQDLQSSKVFPSAQGKMGWNGQPFSGFHSSKNENAFKLSYVWEVPSCLGLMGKLWNSVDLVFQILSQFFLDRCVTGSLT